jgi:hypothetical protein
MAEHHYDGIVNPETHHEKSDVDVRALIWFVVIFIAFAIVTHIGLWMMFKFFASLARGTTNSPLSSVSRPADSAVPPLPRLQPFPTREASGEMVAPNASTPPVDMELMRADEEKKLKELGWADRQKGIVRIPIEDAKRLVVQRGLPVVQQ